MTTIAIASDHAGFKTKQAIIGFLEKSGYSVTDHGTYSEASADYPDFAHPLAASVENGKALYGIALCGSGNGINMTVNKYGKIRSALCWSEEIAALARKHNDANICAIPARFVTEKKALEIVNVFLNTGFEGGRHERRVKKISAVTDEVDGKCKL
ncbi:MAG: ribose 5-phosphate isomerase B [Bacteroidetes bacterium]|nr:ribose 5-phosphate isomerase B [Bacteroidota bacterium]